MPVACVGMLFPVILMLLAAGRAQASSSGEVQWRLPVLTKAAEVRSLTPDQAQLGYPVRLLGGITYNVPTWSMTFIQDSTAGVFIWRRAGLTNVHAGDFVEVRGVSRGGEIEPIVADPEVHVLGRAPLPPPHRYSMDELLTGKEDSQ